MAKLTAAQRNKLPDSAFALPGRRFPIYDEPHRVAALRLMHNASPFQQAIIKRKVAQRRASR